MQTYETIFVTTPTLTEDEERSTVEIFAQVVSEGGGALVANERMGRRRLAYPIEKHTDGVYIRFLYDAEADVPKELERRIRLSDRILRALTVRLETKRALAAKEQAVRDIQARAEAAERERLEQEAAAAAAAAAPPEAAPEAAPEEGSAGDTQESTVEPVSPAPPAPPTETAGEDS